MKNQYDAANMYCTEQIPLMFFFISNQEKVIIILGIRKSIIMMNIQFNRARKLAHYGEKKENIQIKSYLIQDHPSLVLFPSECSHMELI